MSKSTSMLPSLAGGSGVAAHTLTDSDLMKVVDAATMNANRDRKMTLAELKSYMSIGTEAAKSIFLDISTADPTTGIIVLNASNYKSNLQVVIVGNPTTNPPPASPGYYTLQVDGALPPGSTIRIRGLLSGSSWTTTGTILPVKIQLTNSYSFGLGSLVYPYPALVPLVEAGDFSAVVMYDGVTWCGNSTDVLALTAYNQTARSIYVTRGTLTATSGIISTTNTNLSSAFISLGPGLWEISATALMSNATAGTWYQATLALGLLSTAPAFTDDSIAHVSVPPPPSGETYGYATIPVPSKIVSGGVSYSLWGLSTAAAAVAVRGWTIKATPTV